ncbi:Batten's disease protein Cln3 [Xylaria bambusicola]|uniref:Batten's disease protein Cln3 n=1 Tax=Xylaria bambusicola TaxID=326684 RepID=UPI002007C273|nr:Batten's disease protein Cln3 [Xylaria bambusicola]KAI0515144.1 Batten's disease protein Cln3 [Xylaria bambusicola]
MRHATRSPASSSGLLPMPGSPSASWALYKARLASVLHSSDVLVLVAFWLFGLINNVLYVVILSAAQDLVGPEVPKGLVLLANILPSFSIKLVGPYFIHKVPYSIRIIVFAAVSSVGMFMIAFAPADESVAVKMVGVMLASLSSGGGELSFLGLTHYYGHISLAAWGSGTGAAGLVGAGLYVLLTDWLGFSVKNSLLASAYLPVVMLISFFLVLPRQPLRDAAKAREYQPLQDSDEPDSRIAHDVPTANAASSLLTPSSHAASGSGEDTWSKIVANLGRAKSLFFPYMLPLFLVYIAEYIINQGVSPTLLFPLESTPFNELRDFYPMYGFLYQIGVFVSRSSIAFVRVHHLYLASLLQVGNLVLLTLHSLFNFIPSVYVVFVIVFWEGLLGGGVYVNTFAEIMENVPFEEREFSLGATSVSDSAGICIAGFVSMAMEVWLCNYQVQHGRDWCKRIRVG